MSPPAFVEEEELRSYEGVVKKHSFRLGCKLNCFLTAFDKQNSAMENKKILRKRLVRKVESLSGKKLSSEQKKVLLTPGAPPRVPFASVSISHSAFTGGFIIAPFVSNKIATDPQTSEKENNASTSLSFSRKWKSPSHSHCAVSGADVSVEKEILPHKSHLGAKEHGFFLQPFVGIDLESPGRAKKKTVLRISNNNELIKAPSPAALWSAKESAYKSINAFQDRAYIRQISVFGWQSVSHSQVYDYQFSVEEKNIQGQGFACFFKYLVVACSFLQS